MTDLFFPERPIPRRTFVKRMLAGLGGMAVAGCDGLSGSETGASSSAGDAQGDFAPALSSIAGNMKSGELRPVSTTWPGDRGPRFDDFFSVDGNWRSEPNGWSERLLYDPLRKKAHFLGCRWRDWTLFSIDLRTLQWTRVGHPDTDIGLQTTAEEYRPFNRPYLALDHIWVMPENERGAYNPRWLHRMPLAGPYRFKRFGAAYPSNQPPTPDWGATYVPGLGHVRSEIAGDYGGQLRVLRDGSSQWEHLASTRSHGRSNTVYWNPVRREAIAWGGANPGNNYGTRREVARVLPTGEVRDIGPTNVDYHGSVSFLTHDPISGDYLLWRPEPNLLWRSEDAVAWHVERDWSASVPFGAQEQRQSWTAVPELGIILLVDYRKGLYVYRPLAV